MNTLISMRSNIIYNKKPKKNKDDADEFQKFVEVVLLCDKPKYKIGNDQDIIRERAVEQFRFVVSADNMKQVATQMLAFAVADDEEIDKLEKD